MNYPLSLNCTGFGLNKKRGLDEERVWTHRVIYRGDKWTNESKV